MYVEPNIDSPLNPEAAELWDKPEGNVANMYMYMYSLLSTK